MATYATHDHDPLKAMWETLHQDDTDKAKRTMAALSEFIGHAGSTCPSFSDELHLAFLKALFAMVMITDVFGRHERYNIPGTANAGNWTQRMHIPVEELPSQHHCGMIRELLSTTGRAMPRAAA